MPAESIAQAKAAQMALAAKRGSLDPSELTGAAKSMYESMTIPQLEEFTYTKEEKE